jgi:hypothetical protein
MEGHGTLNSLYNISKKEEENEPRKTESRQLILNSLISLLPCWIEQTSKPISNLEVSQKNSWRAMLMKSSQFAMINAESKYHCNGKAKCHWKCKYITEWLYHKYIKVDMFTPYDNWYMIQLTQSIILLDTLAMLQSWVLLQYFWGTSRY